jgi:hypothetical protein
MPLELVNSRLYIQAGLAARHGELVQRRLRVDTGSEDLARCALDSERKQPWEHPGAARREGSRTRIPADHLRAGIHVAQTLGEA